MQIVRLKAQGYKGVDLIEIAPRKGTNLVGGRNRQGKSSLLDSICSCLGGRKLCPAEPIKQGQEKALIEVEMDGDPVNSIWPFVAKREFWRKEDGTIDSSLTVTTKDGFEAPSPQKFLNDLAGKLGFDPEAFLRMESSKQVEVLRELVGLDFTELDKEYNKAYSDRTKVNTEGKELAAQYKGLPFHTDVPAEEQVLDDLVEQLKVVQNHNSANNEKRNALVRLESRAGEIAFEVKRDQAEVERLERQLAIAKETLETSKKKHEDHLAKVAAQAAVVNDLQDKDTSEIENQMKQLGEVNRKVRANLEREKMEQKLNDLRQKSLALTEKLKEIESQKQAMQEAAKWPVDGLGYSGNIVTFNGYPFAQASAYEQRQVAMGICVALNPSMRFAILKDGSLLDDDALLEFASIAAEHGVQLFIERVGKGEENNLIIENGKVQRIDEDMVVPPSETREDGSPF